MAPSHAAVRSSAGRHVWHAHSESLTLWTDDVATLRPPPIHINSRTCSSEPLKQRPAAPRSARDSRDGGAPPCPVLASPRSRQATRATWTPATLLSLRGCAASVMAVLTPRLCSLVLTPPCWTLFCAASRPWTSATSPPLQVERQQLRLVLSPPCRCRRQWAAASHLAALRPARRRRQTQQTPLAGRRLRRRCVRDRRARRRRCEEWSGWWSTRRAARRSCAQRPCAR
jgi:hypothetical protein